MAPAGRKRLLAANAAHPGFANQFLIALAHQALADAAARKTLLAAVHAMSPRPPFVRGAAAPVQICRSHRRRAAVRRERHDNSNWRRRWYYRGRIYNDRVSIPGSRRALKLSEEQQSAAPRIALSGPDPALLQAARAGACCANAPSSDRTPSRRWRASCSSPSPTPTAIKPATWTEHVRIDGSFRPIPSFHRKRSAASGASRHLLHATAPTTRFHDKALTSSPCRRSFASAAKARKHFRRCGMPSRSGCWGSGAGAQSCGGAVRGEALTRRVQHVPMQWMSPRSAGLLALAPTPKVHHLATAIARRLIDAGKADAVLIAALLEANAQDVRGAAIRAIDDRADWPWANPTLARAALTSRYDDVQGRTRHWLRDRVPTREQRATRHAGVRGVARAVAGRTWTPLQRAGLAAALALFPAAMAGSRLPPSSRRRSRA